MTNKKNTPQTAGTECGVDSRLECSKCKSKISCTDNFCSQCGAEHKTYSIAKFLEHLLISQKGG